MLLRSDRTDQLQFVLQHAFNFHSLSMSGIRNIVAGSTSDVVDFICF